MSRLFGVTTDFLLKDELSEEEDYTRENKAKSPVIGAVSGIYWLLVTAVYLFYTFGPMGNGQPKYSWFIWAQGESDRRAVHRKMSVLREDGHFFAFSPKGIRHSRRGCRTRPAGWSP